MTREEEKEALCCQHENLLHIIMTYGNRAMLLPQLRALCLSLGLYTSAQAVNRAVRALREGGILTRQTWVGHNSDLIMARKYAVRYFSGASPRETATPHRPNTMAPYILTARKIDWLLSIIDKEGLRSLTGVETYLRRHACTMFLRRPMLADYYRTHADILSQERPETYRAQLARLETSALIGQSGTAPLADGAVTTLEASHRRGIYITSIRPDEKAVALALFAGRETSAERVADWAIDAYTWLASLLPYYRALLTVYTLDANHTQTLRAALSACPAGSSTNYWHRRLEAAHVEGLLYLRIENTDFVNRWCGGVHRIDL